MALNLTKLSELGDIASTFLGMGEYSTLNTRNKYKIDRIVNRGYAKFLDINNWSFLVVHAKLAFNAYVKQLPADFDHMHDRFTYIDPSAETYHMKETSVNRILDYRNTGMTNQRPTHYCIRNVGTRKEVMFNSYQSALTFDYSYRRLTPKLVTDSDVVVCGAGFTNTLEQVVIGVADKMENGKDSEMEEAVILMGASASKDKEQAPDSLGDYGGVTTDHDRVRRNTISMTNNIL